MLPSVIRGLLRMAAVACGDLFTGECHRVMCRRGGCEQQLVFEPSFTTMCLGDACERDRREQSLDFRLLFTAIGSGSTSKRGLHEQYVTTSAPL